jgi:hypothetical protein
METHLRIPRRIIAASLVTATITLTACTLDVGPQGSDCQVWGNAPLGSANGLTVLVTLPERCPFRINNIPQAMPFSATIFASSGFTPDGSYLYHAVANRLGIPIQTDVTQWVETTGGRVRSFITTAYVAATAAFTINGTPSSTGGTGEDRWYASTTQIDTAVFGASVNSTTYVRLTYYREYNTTVDADVQFANPYEPVNLTVNVPSWVPSPYRHLWYRNGEFVAEGPQTMMLGAGGPNETVDFEVTTTGSDGTQIRGSRSVVSREYFCSDPTVFIC